MRISDWSSDVCSSDLGRDEALLRLHIGRDRPEQRWLLLIGTVGAAEPLDRSIGFPACFEQIMDGAALVRGAKIGMIAAPRSTGLGQEEGGRGVHMERSEARRVGKEGVRTCKSRRLAYQQKKQKK